MYKNLLFQAIDWYHCNIYRGRFFFFAQLIGKASLTIEGELEICLYTNNSKVISSLPVIAQEAEQFILYYRENT